MSFSFFNLFIKSVGESDFFVSSVRWSLVENKTKKNKAIFILFVLNKLKIALLNSIRNI